MSNFSLNNNNFEFYNIFRNSGISFINKEELINLHTKKLLLDSCIKLRKDIEYEYNKLKINQLKDEIDELQFQQKIFEKRNQDILSNIQSNSFKGFELASRTNQSLDDLFDGREKYQNYLNNISDTIQTDFIQQLNLKCNSDIKLIENEQNRLKQNNNMFKFHNDLYNKLKSTNEETEKIFKQINEHYSRNPYILKNQNKDNNDIGIININISKNSQNINSKCINEENDNISGTNKKYIKYIEKQYVLNKNHNPGKLDIIRQSQIDQLNSQLKKEYVMQKNEINNSISSGSKSFESINKPENFIFTDEMNVLKDNNIEINNKDISNKTEIINTTTTVIEKKVDIKINTSHNIDTSNINNIPNNTLEFKKFEVPKEDKLIVEVEDSPDLNSPTLSIYYKILVLNKLINKIDSQSKILPEGKIYDNNILNNINKLELKNKFYELLKSIQNDDPKEIEVLSNNNAIQLICELLYSSPENCIIDTEKLLNNNDYNEIDLKKDICSSHIKIFEIILSHIKKMIDLKRIDANLACEIFIKSILKNELENNNLKTKLNQLFEKIFQVKNDGINQLKNDDDDEYNDFEKSDDFDKKGQSN